MALITSNGTGGGLASATTTWTGGVVPVEGDSVQILAGDVVEIDGAVIWGDGTATALTIDNGGELKMSTTVSSSIDVKGGVIQHGTLSAGTIANSLPNTISTRISWNYLGALKANRWKVEADASVILHGCNKTLRARLVNASTVGQQTFLISDVTGWEVGDWITITHTEKTKRGLLVLNQITAISGNNVTIDTPLDTARLSNAQVLNCSQRLKVGGRIDTESSDMFFYHDPSTTPSTVRYINQVETQNVATNAGGHTGFSIYANTPETLVAYKAPISRVSCHIGGTNYAYTRGLGFRDCDHPYNPEMFECVYSGVETIFARSTITLNRCATHQRQFTTTWGVCVALNFIECWFNGGALNNLGLTQASAPLFKKCEFSCGYVMRNAYSSPVYEDCKFIGFYLLPEQTVASETKLIRTSFDAGFVGDVETHTFGTTLKTGLKLLDFNNDPTSQYSYNFEGSYKRDSVFFKTKVASIRMISRNQPAYPFTLSLTDTGTQGVQKTFKVSIYVDTAVTQTSPEIVVTNDTENVSHVVPLVSGWQDIVLNITPSVTSPLFAYIKVQDGTIWVDDVFFDSIEKDIGQELFQGGTEISTVVDITDTNKYLTISNIIPGSIVEIYDNEVANVGNNDTLLASTNNSGATFTYTHNGTPNDIRILVLKPGYVEQILDFTLANADQGLIVNQVVDNND